jgi:hypothetical protein
VTRQVQRAQVDRDIASPTPRHQPFPTPIASPSITRPNEGLIAAVKDESARGEQETFDSSALTNLFAGRTLTALAAQLTPRRGCKVLLLISELFRVSGRAGS